MQPLLHSPSCLFAACTQQVLALEGLLCPQVSAGGLVSALMGVSNFKTCWIGWPGELI